jgi:hypothetical protein
MVSRREVHTNNIACMCAYSLVDSIVCPLGRSCLCFSGVGKVTAMVKTPESRHRRIALHLQGVGEWVGLDLDEAS